MINPDSIATDSVAVDTTDQMRYPYVNYELNHFIGGENSMFFRNYYQQFDHMMRSGSGKLNIVHFGGSHIQADIWSNVIRERLQSLDTAIRGARGILFPFKAAGTNRPYSYSVTSTGNWEGFRSSYNKHHSTWGVSGITATTTDDSVSLKFTFRQSPYRVKTQQLKILSNIDSTSYRVTTILDSGVTAHTFRDPRGYTIVNFSQEVDSFTLVFERPDSIADELQFYGVVADNMHPGIRYHSIGVNGSRFVSFKRCALFQDQLPALNPDLVIMSIGTNDSSDPDYDSLTYRQNFREFLDMMRWANPECAFILTVPNDNYVRRKYHNDNLRSVQHIIYDLAKEYDAKIWDLYAIMGGSGSSKTWLNEGMMKSDLVHFTNDGYRLKGDIFYKAFREDYLRWHNDRTPVWTE
ncbi:MAG: GDSL-type esterase/lipase family protein [Salibacteraceae bacterium]